MDNQNDKNDDELFRAVCKFEHLKKLKPATQKVMVEASGSLQSYLNKALADEFNTSLFGVCAGLLDNGFTAEQAVEVIYAMPAHRQPRNGEIERAVSRIYNADVDGEATEADWPLPDKVEPHEVLSNVKQLGALPCTEDELEDYLGESPEEADNAADFVRHYFKGLDDPCIYLGGQQYGQIQKLSTWLADSEIVEALAYDQIMASPMKRLLTEEERPDNPGGGKKAEFCNDVLDVVVVESDTLPSELQLGVIIKLAGYLPLVSIVDSGNKSYHATFSLRGLTREQVDVVRQKLTDLGADRGVLTPQKLVRLGGVKRTTGDRKMQEVLWIDPDARMRAVEAGKLAELLGETEEADEAQAQLSLIYPSDLDMDELELDDLVEGALGQGVLGCLYAPPTSGKTFVALDMASHIATGRNWHGRDVEQGAVLYIGLEGKNGVRRRLKALKKEGIIDNDTPLVASPSSIDLLSADSILRWIKLMREQFEAKDIELKLVIIDTLLRAMAGGNINDSKDMSQAVDHGNIIIDEIGCSVLLVHHTGKDVSRGEMGSTALRAGLDSSILVQKENGVISVKPSKQKDMSEGSEMDLFFKLNVVNVGMTVKGKLITSCTIVEAENPMNQIADNNESEKEDIKRDMVDHLVDEAELTTSEWGALCKETNGITTRKFNICRLELKEAGRVTNRREGNTIHWFLPS